MNDSVPSLRRLTPAEIKRTAGLPVDDDTLRSAGEIVANVGDRGIDAVRAYADQFDERAPDEPLVLGPDAMRAALEDLDPDDRLTLERTAERIGEFAAAQKNAINSVEISIPGGKTGHTIEPVSAAGCYAPAGRYPLPSSVLMTAVTARTAGCERVVVASPGANPVTLAAAAIAGADEFLAVGGAHAIAALAYGFDGFDPCDVIAGPGNRWVTAAKQLVNGAVGIDMLAGPSELLIIADDTADPMLITADLLAQAEHDTDAVPMLITTDPTLPEQVDQEIARQLPLLDTQATAREAIQNGFVILTSSLEEARSIADTIAAEHLEVMVRDADKFAQTIRNAGAIFIGARSAEVLGDYGVGPNHTLPTGGTARFQAGLSVMHFLRLRTWIRIDHPEQATPLANDAATLARMEGLTAHKAAALARTNDT